MNVKLSFEYFLIVVHKVNNFVSHIGLTLSFCHLKIINLQVVNVYITVH